MPGKGIGQIACEADALQRGRGIIHESVSCQFPEVPADMGARCLRDTRNGVMHRDIEAVACENRGPGPAYEARADDGDLGHVRSVNWWGRG